MATRPAHQQHDPNDSERVSGSGTGKQQPPEPGSGKPKPTVRERAAKVLRREPRYPHDMHPGLVPGIGVDEQRVRYGTDRLVFGVAATLILGFVGWGILSTESLKAVSDVALAWVVDNTGWLFNALIAVIVIFMLFVGFSRYGKIPLGVDGEKPEYSKFSWIAMMFSAGVGIGLFFFGPYEPLTYYLSPPPGTAEPETAEAMHQAMAQSYFHWGFHAWAIYALVGAAVAYGSYRRGRVPLMSSIFTPLLGRTRTEGLPGRAIDMFAIVATLFGTAASLGIGALQIGRGVEIVGGIGRLPNAALIGIIAILTAAFIASAVSGIGRGIRWLSNINMSLALVLAVFIFLAGPTLFLLNLIPSSVSTYFSEVLNMMSKGPSWGEESAAFSESWTVFYWAWWISWSPFVGIFLARISRGRTLREYVQYALVMPTLVCILAFGIFGGTAIWMRTQGQPGINIDTSPQDLFFQVLNGLPLSQFTPFLAMFCIAIFFITSADSASLVMGTLSQRGKPVPDRKVTVFWGLAMMGIAVVMLLVGGNTALEGLQNLIIVSALPFAVILLLMMVAFTKDLHTDPLIIRREYAAHALENAVRAGIDEHGDNFAIAVEKAPDGEGAGAGFDSFDTTVTDWYQRTDEEGRPVDYNYESGEYADGWTAEGAAEEAGSERSAPGTGELADDGERADDGDADRSPAPVR
ncbi:BCCT family transporter [Arthrobacter sp. YD2]|uniref:BCCT family transporter n=1 Tax=Arthrobacter sp. YD2 TaxID=3058046 RepID=UPI0025B4CA0C|nr:BCCT family transporter [Arthrobacter sp. YD2]MDN3902889.1 BCCT family transporter [Arthrobacter sp. YD2]